MANLKPLSPELAKIARDELGEVSERIESDLNILKDWLRKQQHINARYDDQFLIMFLRGCKFSIERAKEKIDNYYSARTLIPEFFDNRDPKIDDLNRIIEQGIILPLPMTETPDGPRIFLIRIGAFDPNTTTLENIMKVSYMITDILVRDDPNTVISGQTILVDMQGIKVAHLKLCSPGLIKKMTTTIQEAFPIRQKGIHFVNPITGFDALYKIFSGFLGQKLRDRLSVHDTFEDLHTKIPKKLLPKEYGGDADKMSILINNWKVILNKKRDWFIEESKYRTNESKRIGKSKLKDESFGVDGTFRSLQVD